MASELQSDGHAMHTSLSSWSVAGLLVVTLGALGCGTAASPADDPADPAAPAPAPSSDPTAPPTTSAPEDPSVEAPAPEAPPPLQAPLNQWTWFDIPGTMCGNGEQTGLAVNWGTGNDLLIVHDGGGACWDETSCRELPKLGVSSDYINTGYTRATFDKSFANPAKVPSGLGGAPLSNGGYLDRTSELNPFRDSSYIFIPYCTGDLSGGDAEQEFASPKRTMHYHGIKNIEAYLPYIVSSFSKASGVTVAGRSAGGFSAAVNFWRYQDAFGDITVNLIDDSGLPLDQNTIALFPTWKAAWKFENALPPDCSECQQNVRNTVPYYSRKYPKSRFAIASYDNDALISAFFLQPPPLFMLNVRNLAIDVIRPLPNVRYFIAAGFDHTMSHKLDVWSSALSKTLFPKAPRSVQFGDWLTRMKNADPSWKNASGFL